MSTGPTRDGGGAARPARDVADGRCRGAVAHGDAPEPWGRTLPAGSGLPHRAGEPGPCHGPRRKELPDPDRRRRGPRDRRGGRVSAQRVRRADRGRGHRPAASPPADLAANGRGGRGGAGAGADGWHSLRDGPLSDDRPPRARSLRACAAPSWPAAPPVATAGIPTGWSSPGGDVSSPPAWTTPPPEPAKPPRSSPTHPT